MTKRTALIAVLLASSLAANGLLVRRLARPAPDASASASPVVASSATPTASAAAPGLLAWDDVADETPEALAARLRAEGLPEKLVFALTEAQLRAQFDARRRELLARKPVEYWSERYFLTVSGGAELRALEREYQAARRAALGAEAIQANLSADALAGLERTYGPIPAAKIAAMQEIISDYSELLQTLQAETGLMTLAEDRERLDLLAQEEQRDLQALLTPDEYLEYQLRRSNAANQVRSQLNGVEVTEAEFRQLYQQQQAFLDQYGTRMTPANAAERRQAEQALAAQAKALLGEERGAEYEANRDFGTRQVRLLATRLNLPPTTASEVSALQRDVQQRLGQIRSNQTLTAAERNAQLAALNTETEATLKAKLTPAGYEALRSGAGLAWMRSLNPTGANPAAASNVIIVR